MLSSFEGIYLHQFGDDGKEVTPVPIPNTEVKLFSADGSWGFSPCESRTLPGYSPYRIYLGFLSCVYRKPYIRTVEKHALTSHYQSGNIYFVSTRFNNKLHVQNTCICNTICGGLAQLGEHLPYKQRVGGSSPSSSTIFIPNAGVAQLVEQLTCNQ